MKWPMPLAAATLAACSFVGPDSDRPAVDAGASDAATDATADGTSRLWGEPVRLTSLETSPLSNYDDPSITDSGILFLAIDQDIFEAQRTDTTTFDTPTLVPELSEPGLAGAESTIWVERDGLRIMFARAGDLMEATRNAEGDMWSAPSPVSELNTGFTEALGQLTNNGLTLYFVSDRDGTFDIYRATRPTVDDPFDTPPEKLAVSSDSLTESSVKLTPDELTMYWAQKAATDPTSAFEMVFAERADTDSDFGPTIPLDDLNRAGAVDSDFTPSPDHQSAFFSSDGDDTSLGERIFFVER